MCHNFKIHPFTGLSQTGNGVDFFFLQETAVLIRIINRRLLVFFTGSTNYFFST